MKTILSALLITFSTIQLISCKKEDAPDAPLSLAGNWELRKTSGGNAGTTLYPAGNGFTANFTADNFVFYDQGTVTSSGIYSIVKDSTNNPPGNYFLFMKGSKFGLWLEENRFFYWDTSYPDAPYQTYERVQ